MNCCGQATSNVPGYLDYFLAMLRADIEFVELWVEPLKDDVLPLNAAGYDRPQYGCSHVRVLARRGLPCSAEAPGASISMHGFQVSGARRRAV